MSKKSLAARLLTRAFHGRPVAPIQRTPQETVGGRIEELEDRSVPAKVAVLGAEQNPTYLADVENTIVATGQYTAADVDVINVSATTPTLAALSAYESVLVFSDYSFQDPIALGNTLAAYVNAGGGVVQAMFSLPGSVPLGGTWAAVGYSPFAAGGTNYGGYNGLGAVAQPGHPVMAGVSTFTSSYYDYRSTGGLAGATLIASWTDGTPLVAEKTGYPGKIVGLNFFPVSGNVFGGSWNASTGGGRLMANALHYVVASPPAPPDVLPPTVTGTSPVLGPGPVSNLGQTTVAVQFSEPTNYPLGSALNPAASATQIKTNDPTAPSGVYWFDTDGAGPRSPFQAYADMVTAGGGWMLAVNSLLGAEPAGNRPDADTGTPAPYAAHTRDFGDLLALGTTQIRHQIDATNLGNGAFDAYYAGAFDGPMPTGFGGFTNISTTNTNLLGAQYGQAFGPTGYGAAWYGVAFSSIPSTPVNGLAGGPAIGNNPGATINSYRIWLRSPASPPAAPRSAADPANYEVVNLGTDQTYGTPDDVPVVLSGVTYSGTTATLGTGQLAAGTYRLTVRDAITDRAGNALDGDANGAAGGDWVREFQVIDPAPLVTGTTPALTAGTLAPGSTTLQLNFSEPVTGAGLAANYRLRAVGADGLLGTPDDPLVPLTAAYAGTTTTLTAAPLPAGVYRLETAGGIADAAGQPLVPYQADFVVPPSIPQFAFETPVTYATGSSPYAVVTADFNGDGTADVATADYSSWTVTVRLSNAAGVLGAATTLSGTGISYPRALASGDFDNDGKADLAVSNLGDSTVTVFLGNGAGGFTRKTTFASGGSSPNFRSVAVGEFNGDGKPDLAVTNVNSQGVSIFLGVGDGTFSAPAVVTGGGGYPEGVAVGDFDSDGDADLVVAYESSGVRLLVNSGTGTFTLGPIYSSGGFNPIAVAVADFNADGRPDVAVMNANSNTVGVLLGNGAGGLGTAVTTPTGGSSPFDLAAADLDGDGAIDLAVVHAGSGGVVVLQGTGTGTFTAGPTVSLSSGYGYGVAVGRVNADALPDIVAANTGNNQVTVALAVPPATTAIRFGATTSLPSGGSYPYGLVVADFNADGVDDVAATNYSSNTVSVQLGDGVGGFGPAVAFNTGGSYPVAIAVADLNLDGKLDLAVSHYSSGVSVLLGSGTGTFSGGVATGFATGSDTGSVAVGDFNQDGRPDLAVTSNYYSALYIFTGSGTGAFTYTNGYNTASGAQGVVVRDFNADGRADLAIAYTSGYVNVFTGAGNGSFSAGSYLVTNGSGPTGLVAEDFNGDGRWDLAVANRYSNTVSVLLGTGGGGFGSPTTVPTGGSNPVTLVATDLDLDGRLDLAVSHNGGGGVTGLRGTGAGGFTLAATAAIGGGGGFGLAVARVNADTLPDLVTTNANSNQLVVVPNASIRAVVPLTSANGLLFDVQTGGFGAGQLVQGTNNAFDGLNRLQVGGADYAPALGALNLADGGRTVVTPVQTFGGLEVRREVTMPTAGGQDFARTVEVLTNPTGGDITTTVRIVGNLGADAGLTVFATQSGNAGVEPGDQWVGTDDADGTGTPAVVHYVHGPNGLVPDAAEVVGDNVVWTYTVTVPAGQTVRLATFTVAAATRAQAVAAAQALVTASGFAGQAGAFLTPAEVASIANFQDPVAPTVVSTTPALPGGPFERGGNTSVQVAFSEAVGGGAVAANFELRSGGPDRVLDTGDDVTIPLTAAYAADTTTLSFADLFANQYRLTVRSTITDLAANPLGGGVDDVRTFEVVDTVAPQVTGVTPAQTDGTYPFGTSELRVAYSEVMAGGAVAANFELRGTGADGLLGTADDTLAPLSAAYAGTTTTLTFPSLSAGVYRLAVTNTLTDVAGNALAGGDYVRDFVVTSTNTAVSRYRWATFNTYDQNYGWIMGNDAAMFGGVNPSNWTDNNGTAGQMSTNLNTLATLFTHQAVGGANATVVADTDYYVSSTNGQITAALFRVQNTTGAPITWTPNFYYSSFVSWSEIASVAVNGVSVWTSLANGVQNGPGQAAVPVSIPANGTSTVIVTSAHGIPSGTRTNQLGFFNNSLTLPAGLAYVDDLPATTQYRWATFNTYDQSVNWIMGDDPAMFGGVAPSTWTDGNGTGGQMSTNLNTLATLFTNRGVTGSNATVVAETDYTYSSTNGQITAALFRVQNTTGAPITWTPNFYYSSFANWGEVASVAVNGVNVWTGAGNGPGQTAVPVSIPAGGTSTVIITSAYGGPNGTRTNQLGFFNNSLTLPAGLAYVDDLPATTQYRWATFNTYDQGVGWIMGDNPAMFGGVSPSTWTDANGTAGQMSTNLGTLATLFPNSGVAGANATVVADTDYYVSSTNGQITAALFRVQNTTGAPITWTPNFYYSSFVNWNEIASVAVNGSSVWTSLANGVANGPGQAAVPVSIPANGTSTVIVTSAHGIPNATRTNQLGFFNNSLTLPAGLAYVDDLVDQMGPTYTLTSPNGFRFDVETRGPGAGQLVDGTNNAFDGLNRLQVGGAAYAPTTSVATDGGRTLATGPRTLAGLTVSREVTVPAAGAYDFARTIDVFTNPTGGPITTTVTVVGNLGTDAATAAFASGPGWVGTDDADGSGAPATIHYVNGPAGLAPTSRQLIGDNIVWTYTLTVPAGQTVRLASFTITAPTRAQAVAAAAALVDSGGFGGEAAAFLTPAERDSLANFQFADTTVELDGAGNLVVTDIANATDDQITVSRAGANIRVSDPARVLTARGAATQVDLHTIEVPWAAVTGKLILNTADGNDTVVIDLTGGSPFPANGVEYNGGAGGFDTLALQGRSVGTLTFNYLNAHDGSVVLDGDAITYTGLDPITSTVPAANVVLTYSTTGETITVTSGGAGQTTVTSTSGETTTFVNPTASLAINAGDTGNDTVIVTSLGSGFNASLAIDGGTGTDAITIAPALNLTAGGGTLTLSAETITLNGGSVTTTGTQTYNGAVVLGANTTTSGADVAFNGTVDGGAAGFGALRSPLAGTHTTDVVRGGTHNAFFADPVTGFIYYMPGYDTGTQALEYPTLADFVSNTNVRVINLAVPYDGTYHAALGGFLYYAQTNSNTMVKVRVSDGAVVASAALAGAGFRNQSAFNWGGYSDICFYVDSGNLLYVVWAPPGGANLKVSRLDPGTLAVQQTWDIPRAKSNTGFAFVANGVVYIGFTYNSPQLNATYDLATSTYNPAYSNALSAVPGDYVTHVYWNPTTNQLFEQSNSHNLVYLSALVGGGGAATSLTVNSAGAATFAAAVGGSAALSSLSVGASTLAAGAIATTGGVSVTTSGAGTITGAVTGGGGLMKAGAGTLTLSGTNTYTGTTTVTAGTLRAGATNTFAPNSNVVLGAAGTLDLNGFDNSIRSLAAITFGSTVTLSATLTVTAPTGTYLYRGGMFGAGSLVKEGGHTFTLGGTSGYTGPTAVNAGTLTPTGFYAYSADSAVTVATGATFDIAGISYEIASLAGAGSVTLGTGGATLTTGRNNTSTTFSGVVSGTGRVTKTGTGTFTLSGANTYAGDTTVSGGTLRLGAAGVVPDASDVFLAGGTVLDLNGFSEAIDGLSGTGTVRSASGAPTLTVGAGDGSTTFSGMIQNGAGTVALIKAGSGTFTLPTANTYTGATTVSAGRLNVNGSVTSNVTVGGGTLGGTGTVNGTLAMSSGTVAPGTSAGILNSGSVTFTSGTIQVEVTGTTAGTQYDQLNVTGTVALGAGTTALSLPTPVIAAGNTYTIVNNDGTDNVTGYFTGLPEGAFVGNFGGTNVYITYAGGTNNNDVQLLTTPTVNGTAGADLMVLRQKAGAPGNYQFSIDNGATFADLGAITTLTVNGLDGNDTLTIDAVNGNPFPSAGVIYNGGNHTSTPGDQLRVVAGIYTTITHNFSNASSGNVDFDGRSVAYTGLEPVLVDVGAVGNVVFNLPAAASAAVLEDDGTPGNGLSRLRSTNGTFETTTFDNPTGSVTINRGDAADALTVTAIPDLTSTLTVGTGALPFQAVTVTGAVTLAATMDLAAFATRIGVTAAVSADDITLDADTDNQVSGSFVGVNITANVTGTGVVAVEGRGGDGGAGSQFGVRVASGASVSGLSTTVTGTGGGGAGNLNYGVTVTGSGSTIEAQGGAVLVEGTGGGTGASGLDTGVSVESGGTITNAGTGAGATVTVRGFGNTTGAGGNNYGVVVNAAASTITSGGGAVLVEGTGGSSAVSGNRGVVVGPGATITSAGTGAGATVTVRGFGGTGVTGGTNFGVYVNGAAALITSSGGAVVVEGTGGSGTLTNNYGVRVELAGAITSPAALTLTGTKGGSTATGILVNGGTISAAGLGTLNGPSGSNVTIDAASTVDFGSLTASAAGATVTVFEDSTTAVNTVAATTINLTSAGAITDTNGAGTNNLTGTTATLAAAGGIDLDTALGSLTATTSAAGAIVIREADAITLTSVSTADGSITITAGGTVSAVSVIDALDASHVVSITTTAGDILVGNVTASGDTVTLTAAGAIEELGPTDLTADVTGSVVNLTAVTGIGAAGTVEINTITTAARGLTASVTGNGPIDLRDTAGGLRVRSATTANGSVTIAAAAGDMIVETVTAGPASAVALSTTTSGNILDDGSSATRVTGGAVTLTAAGAVGDAASGAVDTTAASLTLAAGGNAAVDELDALVVTSAAVEANVFELSNAGALTQTGTITAGGLRLTGSGAATLTAANIVGTLAASRDGSLGFTNAQSLTVGTATGDTGSTSGVTLTPTSSLALTVTGTGNSLTINQAVSVPAGTVTTSSAGNTTVNATVTASGAVQLSFGQDNAGRAAAVNAAVNGSSATVTGGTGNDIVTVAATGATILDVNGGGVPTSPLGVDLVTAVLGGLGAGYVRLNNPVGPTENYRTTVDGTAQATPLTVHANTIADELGTAFPTASGVRRVGVNGATVIDYGPAGATVSVLDLLGGTGADTYFVQFTDTASNALSLLPPLVNVTAADAADAAFVYGTNSPDTVGVNSGNNDRVTSAGVAVRYDGTLEALTVYGKGETGQPGDTFAVRPDQQTAVTIVGGTPLIYPGDTLDLDVLGLVNLNPTLSDPALPDGTFSLTGYGLLSWTGIENFPVPRGLGGSFDFGTATSPVQFGFTPVLPTSSYPAAATEGTGWHGWATTPLYGNQAYNETNLTPALAASPIAALLRDFAYGFQGDASDGVFRVDVAPMKPVQLTALVGIPGGGRDGLVVEWGVANTPTGLPTSWTAITPVGGLFLAAGEMTTVSRILSATDVGNNLSLFVRFRDISGEPHWSVSALDVRPTNPGTATLLPAGLVAPLPVRQEFATDGSVAVPGGYLDQHAFAAVAADGTTIDYYRGKDAIPNSLVTVTVTNGSVVDAAFTAGPGGDTALGSRVLNADAAGYLKSFQVQADAAGEFTFGVRRPTGTATSTVTVADATGFRAGAFTQAFALPTTRRIDFGPTPAVVPQDYGNDGVVGAGYAPFATATYTDVGTNALGWAVGTPLPVAFVPGGTGATAVQRDGVFGGYAPSEFVLDMPGASYVVTATLGDLAARRDDLFVEVLTAGGWVFAKGYNPLTGAYDLDLNGLTSPTGVSPNAGQSLVRTFLAGTVGGQLRVRFGNLTGNPYWSLAALEARPTQAAVSVVLASPTPGGTTATPSANGTDLTEYVVSGVGIDVLPAGTLFTVRPAVGQVTTADADPTTDGVQVAVGADNTARFRVQAPTTAVTNSRIEVEEVTGARQSVATQTYAPASPPPGVPAVRRFDFNGSATAGVTHSSTVGVRGTEVWTPGADYGWLSAVGEFERPTASLPASMTADQKALFRDGATLGGPVGTFRVKVPAAGTNYAVRYYVGDSSKKWPWIRLQVEGGATSGQLATNVNQYWSYVMFGNSGADEYLDIKVFGSATWVLNGIDVAPGATASALPPSLFAPSPQAAAFTVSSGTAPRLTAAELAPVVAEAARRWAAAGADPARLAGVVFSVQDLNAVGRLGEHVPGSVHIDDDAGGKGWFVDATPADDAEFGAAVAVGLGATDAAAARGVDLLTVVMHELGHELGLTDVTGTAAPNDVMAESLGVGVRRLPAGLTPVAPPVVVELPARPTVTVAAAELTVAALPTPALWLAEAETLYAPGVPVAAADDRVLVATAEPVFVRAEPTRVAPPPVFTATAAWPDADALLDLDGVYVG